MIPNRAAGTVSETDHTQTPPRQKLEPALRNILLYIQRLCKDFGANILYPDSWLGYPSHRAFPVDMDPLITAAVIGDVVETRRLLDAGANVNVKDLVRAHRARGM